MLVDPIESEYFIYMYLLSEFQWRFVKLHLELLSYYHCNRDKQREKQRQLKIQTEEPKQSKLRRPPRSEAWSKQKERKDRKKKRREVKEISRKRKAQDAEAADEEEEEDFQDDVKLMKKLKRGKVYNVYNIHCILHLFTRYNTCAHVETTENKSFYLHYYLMYLGIYLDILIGNL